MNQRAEIVIVGAGVAGLALALQLGRQGRDVLIIDKTAPPRDKVCGEGVMPLGLSALRRLDIDLDDLPGAYFKGLIYSSRRQSIELSFSNGAVGRGLRRTVLIEALERAVQSQASVRFVQDQILEPLREGERINGVRGRLGRYHASVVVAADGVNATLARAAGATLLRNGYRMGMRLHFRGPAAARMQRVCVGLFAPHDIYLTPVGNESFLATTMTDRNEYQRIFPNYEDFLRASPYGAYFEDCTADSPVLGWYHPLFEPRRFHVDGMLLAGDAGGGIDPCLGMGVSLALTTAEQALPFVGAMVDQPALAHRHAEGFHSARVNLLRHYRLFDRVFRRFVASSAGSEVLLWGMRHWPEVADKLLTIVAEQRRWRSLAIGDFAGPLNLGRATDKLRASLRGRSIRASARMLRLWSRYD